MKKLLLVTALMAMAAFVLSACATNDTPPTGTGDTGAVTATEAANNNNDAGDTATPVTPVTPASGGNPLDALNAALANFTPNISTDGEHVEGSIFRRGIIAPGPFAGIIGGAIFSNSVQDGEIATMLGTNNSIFSTTDDQNFYFWGQEGIATWEFDQNARVLTMTLQQDVYWHDGVPLTLADLAFTYYVLAHPDYRAMRFSTYERLITGIMDYHNGDADYISGLQLSNNDRTLTIQFDSVSPSLLAFGLWTAPMPKHIFENIPVADMATSDYVFVNPIGWGPFMVENIVPGESVYMVRNENYVQGVPYIERAIVERIEPSLAPAAMESGRFDVITLFPALYYADTVATNFTFVGSRTGNYGYIAFRLGNWCFDQNINLDNPDRYMNNVYLRRAMAHAIDQNELGEVLFNGLEFAATSFLPPIHAALIDPTIPGFPYNPDYANAILDAAGFTMGADGYRTWPNGDDLTVIWAAASNPATENILIPFHIQGWSAIGVRVELWQGRTHDQLYLWDVLDEDLDNDEIHIYTGRWVQGFNPSPESFWGHSIWNPSRYTSPEWDQLLANLSDPRTFDRDFMMNAYAEVQAHLQDVVPFFPTRWEMGLTAVNNRVTHWEPRPGMPYFMGNGYGWHRVKLTAAEPYRR